MSTLARTNGTWSASFEVSSRRIAEELPAGAVIVAVLADGGWKYLSAPFWEGEEIAEDVLWW